MPGGFKISTKFKILLVIATAVIFFDQLTKVLIIRGMYENSIIEIVPGFFNVVHFKNPGAAFGIFNDGALLSKLFLIGTSTAALVIIGVLIRQAAGILMPVALSLIAGGAIGNLIDRVRFGEVTDFLDFYIGNTHWPAFNVADMAISIGVGLAILSYFRQEK
ncbi:MAG: signal peptidase II [Deltaproteobacteria bacterium]|nr:signal peptidase II [Deltaproteobacteria bacterium]